MAVLSTRIEATTRLALEKAALGKRTLSSEVERRLKRSFDEDAKITELLGGREIFALLRIIAASLTAAGPIAFSTRTGKLPSGSEWLDSAFAYDQALRATMAVLEAFRPPGNPAPPNMKTVLRAHGKKAPVGKNARAFNWAVQNLGAFSAIMEVEGVREAKPTLPALNERITPRELRTRRIAADLGPLHDRLRKKEIKK